MPALRKRKSRTSTPMAGPMDAPTYDPNAPKEKIQSSLDLWVEPAPQNPAPSFEEDGLARHGVLETMAPLGQPPSTKVKQKARVLGDAPPKLSFLGRKASAFGEEEATTPEMTPAPELERDDSERLDDEDLHVPLPEQDEDEDDDYMPKSHPKKKQKTSQGAKTPVRGRLSTHNKPVGNMKSPLKNGVNKTTPTVASPSAQGAGLNGLDQVTTQRIEIAVNDAHARSTKDNRPNVGMALREMFNKSRADKKLARALDGVIHQKETADDWSLFRGFIKNAKKVIKRRSKIQQAEEAAKAAKESRAASQDEVSSPAASGEGTPNNTTFEVEINGTATVGLSDSAHPSTSTMRSPRDTFDDAAFSEVTPHPLSTAPAFPAIDAPTPPAPKMGSKSPRKQRATNGKLAPDSELDATAEASTAAAKSPEIGAGSDSGLSDVDEDILHHGPPPAAAHTNGNGIAAAAKKTKAHARPGKKPRANSMKPFGKHKEKMSITAEQRAQEAEIEQRRHELAREQERFRDMKDGYAPMSDMRFEDDETASMTESIKAMGPPGDIHRPRRGGRPSARTNITVQTNGTKRTRDNSSFSSPHPDSAATSRPSTPAAFTHVPTKRLKLNNGQAHQAARTKKSPVKNRDGPIAGIPHTGGGGSRQSGPDDNDPDSPPSESDDLCSACKGAGEFVCCDNCPRVFHFLCCDPPRLEAPTGSFLCNECTAKLKLAEDPGVESSLGPLFKSLESINTRAFALPAEIQSHFENVAARRDGSYHEDVKKFPLARSSGYGHQKPDYLKLVDNEHNTILCVSCGLTSGGKRQMLRCDYCTAYWHLDCLDPPMANPPHINLELTHRDAWRCPRHIEHDFRSGYVAQNDLNDAQDTPMLDAPVARLGRKVRKPRHPQVIQPTFSRGMRNNGLIDIINDPDDDTDGEGNYVFGSEEKDNSSSVYRIPEKGLILDFIDKVKSGRVKKAARAVHSNAQRKASMQNFAARPIQQQQAALNLAKLANKEKDIGLDESTVEALVLSLTAEAPNDVVTAITAAPLAPPSDMERDQLLKLEKLLKIRLYGSSTS